MPAMKLRSRFFLVTVSLFLAASIPGWFAFREITDDIVKSWAARYAQRQVIYDKIGCFSPSCEKLHLHRDWQIRNP